MENGNKPSVQALDAFTGWMRRVEDQLAEQPRVNARLTARINELEKLAVKQPPLTERRDVGKLVRAARAVVAAEQRSPDKPLRLLRELDEVLKEFAGDYT